MLWCRWRRWWLFFWPLVFFFFFFFIEGLLNVSVFFLVNASHTSSGAFRHIQAPQWTAGSCCKCLAQGHLDHSDGAKREHARSKSKWFLSQIILRITVLIWSNLRFECHRYSDHLSVLRRYSVCWHLAPFVMAAGRLTNGSFNISQHTADREILKLKICTNIDEPRRKNPAEPGHNFN